MVAHNASFDMSFIEENLQTDLGLAREFTIVDTVALARFLLPHLNRCQVGYRGEGPERVSGKSSPGCG